MIVLFASPVLRLLPGKGVGRSYAQLFSFLILEHYVNCGDTSLLAHNAARQTRASGVVLS